VETFVLLPRGERGREEGIFDSRPKGIPEFSVHEEVHDSTKVKAQVDAAGSYQMSLETDDDKRTRESFADMTDCGMLLPSHLCPISDAQDHVLCDSLSELR